MTIPDGAPDVAPAVLAALQAEPGQWTVAALAEDLEVSERRIHAAVRWLAVQGFAFDRPVPKPRPTRRTRRSASAANERRQEAVRLFMLGTSAEAIAVAVGVSVTTVQRYLSGLDVPHRDRIVTMIKADPKIRTIEVARRLRCTTAHVRTVVRQTGVRGTRPRPTTLADIEAERPL